ncbi:MAG: GNAT family N-acetyltransferase [Firmicutes bacterium]|nr:GNAT family N-acetyltransferase [Bacillota bacterium]
MQRNDLTFVSRIFLEGFGQSVLHYVGGASSGIERALHDIFAAILEHQPQGMLVAEAEGCIGGYVIAIPSMPYLWWHVISRGHLWQWAKRWLQGDYGIELGAVLSLAQNKAGFALSQIRLARHTNKARGHTAQILSIAVHPSYRGQGIGHALLHKALGYLATTSAAFVKLEVRPDNLPARRLYEDLGFIAVSRTCDSQGPWIVMLKSLRGGPLT